jgi:F-type H+-transporting ATPase subunit b
MTPTMPMLDSTPSRRPVLRACSRVALAAAAVAIVLGAPGSALAQHDPHDPHGGADHGADHGHAHGADHGHAHGADHGHAHGDDHGHGHGHAADPTAHFNWTDFGYASKDVNGGPLGDEADEEPMSPPFIMMLFNFGIVVAILLWKVRPGLLRYTARRHETIKAALEEAGLLREQARAKLDEYTAQIDKAEKEIEQMVVDIRQGAEAEKQRILADAQAQADAMKRDAEQRISAEIERARLELEREVVAAAIAVAERLIRDKATRSDHTQLADSFIQDIQTQADQAASAPSR